MRKLSLINESLLGNIQKKVMGGEVRKEDDVNLLDVNGLLHYILDRYDINPERIGHWRTGNVEMIFIDVIKFYRGYSSIYLSFSDVLTKIEMSSEISNITDLMNILNKDFYMKTTGEARISVKSKKGEVSNKIVIELLDVIANMSFSVFNRKDKVNESLLGDIQKKVMGGEVRQEDIPEQDPYYWWRYIELDNVKKYPKDELKSLDISLPIIQRLERTLNIETPEYIDIFFRYEVWDLEIEHITPYGGSTYVMRPHGNSSPYTLKFSDLGIDEKRSIKQRLETKTFYIYTHKHYRTEYYLREEPEYKGEKGIKLL